MKKNIHHNRDWLVTVMLTMLLILVVGLTIAIVSLSDKVSQLHKQEDFETKLITFKLPVSYITQEPECADKLLREMGIDNVRILNLTDSID